MGEVSTGRDRCRALKRDGTPCGGYGDAGGFCFAHDPARAAKLAEARRRGGHARHGRRIGATGAHEPVQIDGPADLLGLLARAVNDCLALENSLSRARTIGYIGSVYADVWKTSELERRLAAVEGRLGHEPSEL